MKLHLKKTTFNFRISRELDFADGLFRKISRELIFADLGKIAKINSRENLTQ